ncbi:MAG: hypothetical protein JXB45_05830 [Candidatus Krumholzibacteriota bacterium]|nr:hypothetical protein [Candidatus Krumholzibacteriota bacterium]
MRGKKLALVIIVVLLVAVVVSVWTLRDYFAERTYRQAGEKLSHKLTPEMASKYGEELKYSLDKFWSCYRQEIVGRNDMIDVMDRLERLLEKPELKDHEVFDFIGFVSKTYTRGIQERHREQLEK